MRILSSSRRVQTHTRKRGVHADFQTVFVDSARQCVGCSSVNPSLFKTLSLETQLSCRKDSQMSWELDLQDM